MPTLSESQPQTGQHNWTDFKVFIIDENSGNYAKQLEESLNNPENPDLIHEINESFNLENLKIFKKDKIIFIISNFKENWQENAVREIINKARENKSKILLITLNNPPLEFKNKVYTFKARNENQLLAIPKLLIGSVLTPGLVCIDPDDMYEYLIRKDYGKIEYFSYKTNPNMLNKFKDFINDNISKNIKSIFIQIELSYENQFKDVEDTVSIFKNILNPENIIYSAWFDKNYENKEMKIYLIIFN
ncbi:hypothetical protein [Persephonella sp.]|uniref:hypothetical protein n=1 Tax=Persephonella sp. TaxID=2060922 RepID=UPI0025F1DA8F|nr:hypothetical protein [Persephonella sp.]